MSRVLVGITVLVLLAAGGIGAQAPSALPPRDSTAPATGTGSISGRVVDAATGAPLRRAGVRIIGPSIRGSRSTTTDSEGRYVFAALPAGSFNLTVMKTGFVDWSYGQSVGFGLAKQLILKDHQALDKIDVALPHGAVITGRVVDEFGDPAPDVQVMPLRNQYTVNGRRPVVSGRSALTNDVGEFRLYGLPPGQYVISASGRPVFFGQANPDDRSGYATTYFPGSANPAEAQALTVTAGQQLSDVSLTLVPTRTASVSGLVMDKEGRPVRQGMVNAMPRGNGMVGVTAGAPLRPDGAFTLSGLSPGQYVLRAQLGTAGPGTPPDVSVAFVNVNGVDVTGVQLAPPRLVTARGQIVVDPASVQAFRPQTMRFAAYPVNLDDSFLLGPTPVGSQSPVRDDLSVEIKGYSGNMSIRSISGPDWMIRSITLNGMDVTDSITFGEEDFAGLVIDLTNRIPEIAGYVTNGNGERVDDYLVMAFPIDVNQWQAVGQGRGASARPTEGRYSVKALRPGDYYVAAVDRVPNGQWLDPDFLRSLSPLATRISLREGETKALDLRLIEVR